MNTVFWNRRRWPYAAAGAVILATAMVILTGCGSTSVEAKQYHCPMHPTVVSDKPGECPICGMNLVPIHESEGAEHSTAGHTERPAEQPAPGITAKKGPYACPMHPEITSDKRDRCPKCNMYLEILDEPEAEPGPDQPAPPPAKAPSEHGHEPAALPADLAAVDPPAGLAPVSLSPENRRRLGVTLGEVEHRPVVQETRTSARLAVDETRLTRVSTKVEGWVDTLHVNVTGQFVKRGQPLLTVYSPELVATQQELLTALAMSRQLAASPVESVARGGADLIDAARRRLRLWDITPEQIARIETTGQIEKTLTVYAPASGYVLEKTVLAGQRVMAGESLLVVADLSRLWGLVDLYETDLAFVRVGTRVELSLPYLVDRTFRGRISFIDPVLDPQTRTLQARLEIANPGMTLKPEMYADARLRFDMGDRLVVPDRAVMRTGTRDYAFVEATDGRLVPRELRLGARTDGYYEVLAGLAGGERVVTSANFLIDSESSLRAALAAVTHSH